MFKATTFVSVIRPNRRECNPGTTKSHKQLSANRAVRLVLAAAYGSAYLFIGSAVARDYTTKLHALKSTNHIVDFDGTGNYHMPVSTRSPAARHYFEQGIILAWGFNFAEAVRSFREATRYDGHCAPCYWGLAYALGPSINHDMDLQQAAAAYQAITRASSLTTGATPLERALIAALASRYSVNPRAEREPLDRAYADAMRALTLAQPDNADVLTLAADAEMNVHPHDYWQEDGIAQPWTPEILAWLERALALAPGNPAANHYLIHLLEDSPEPQRALPAARRLLSLAPGVGHLVHMPAHIFMRLGRYHEATQANQRAITADRIYLRAAHGSVSPAYVNGYVLHNIHFLWASALMEGASGIVAEAAAKLARGVNAASLASARSGTAQHFLALPLYTYLRFGDWAAIRAAPRPPAAAPYTIGVWHYGRGVTAARAGNVRIARAELRALEAIASRPELARSEVKFTNSHASLLGIAVALLRAEIDTAVGDLASAVDQATLAVARQDKLKHDEPSIEVVFLARQRLGALLLAADQPDEAEAVYRVDLDRLPENGYALAGLAASLRAQGRMAEAADVDSRLARAWAFADVPVPPSPSGGRVLNQ